MRPFAPDLSESQHQKRDDEEIYTGARRRDQKCVVVAHIAGVRFEGEPDVGNCFNEERGRSEDPAQVVNASG